MTYNTALYANNIIIMPRGAMRFSINYNINIYRHCITICKDNLYIIAIIVKRPDIQIEP